MNAIAKRAMYSCVHDLQLSSCQSCFCIYLIFILVVKMSLTRQQWPHIKWMLQAHTHTHARLHETLCEIIISMFFIHFRCSCQTKPFRRHTLSTADVFALMSICLILCCRICSATKYSFVLLYFSRDEFLAKIHYEIRNRVN